ncbi:hypothetical protein C8Q79DRAFT_977200 [Trametes meyenii]|nr:hypothetical protein C8Q79DRAFT_977200 [Trametes meyenii]
MHIHVLQYYLYPNEFMEIYMMLYLNSTIPEPPPLSFHTGTQASPPAPAPFRPILHPSQFPFPSRLYAMPLSTFTIKVTYQ